MTDAYFERLGDAHFRPTERTSGAWSTSEQHVGPSLGLLVHLVEAHRDARRDDALQPARLSYDLLGTMPVGPVTTHVSVLRPGRTVEVVEAVLSAAGRPVVRLRAWLLQEQDTRAVEGSAVPPLPPPDALAPWDPTSVWPGGFLASVQVRREQVEPGRARCWVRTDVPLLADEPVGPLASAAGLLDVANGLTVRADPRAVAFPNVDLTAHLLRAPEPGWLGLDTTVSFGPTGLGLTASVLHDERGPLGSLAQALTVRPVPQDA